MRALREAEERPIEAWSTKVYVQPKGCEYVEWPTRRHSHSTSDEGFQKADRDQIILLYRHAILQLSLYLIIHHRERPSFSTNDAQTGRCLGTALGAHERRRGPDPTSTRENCPGAGVPNISERCHGADLPDSEVLGRSPSLAAKVEATGSQGERGCIQAICEARPEKDKERGGCSEQWLNFTVLLQRS